MFPHVVCSRVIVHDWTCRFSINRLSPQRAGFAFSRSVISTVPLPGLRGVRSGRYRGRRCPDFPLHTVDRHGVVDLLHCTVVQDQYAHQYVDGAYFERAPHHSPVCYDRFHRNAMKRSCGCAVTRCTLGSSPGLRMGFSPRFGAVITPRRLRAGRGWL